MGMALAVVERLVGLTWRLLWSAATQTQTHQKHRLAPPDRRKGSATAEMRLLRGC